MRLDRVGDPQQRLLPFGGVVADQRTRALSAAAQAASVSAGPERGALRCTSPVAGFTRSIVAPEAAGRSVPAR